MDKRFAKKTKTKNLIIAHPSPKPRKMLLADRKKNSEVCCLFPFGFCILIGTGFARQFIHNGNHRGLRVSVLPGSSCSDDSSQQHDMKVVWTIFKSSAKRSIPLETFKIVLTNYKIRYSIHKIWIFFIKVDFANYIYLYQKWTKLTFKKSIDFTLLKSAKLSILLQTLQFWKKVRFFYLQFDITINKLLWT